MAVKSVNPRVQVISVESECASGFYQATKGIRKSFRRTHLVDHFDVHLAGHPIHTECKSTLADGLAVPMVGGNAYATAAPLIDKVVCVRLVFDQMKERNGII